MKKTILVKHNIDYSAELTKARLVAEWAVQNKMQISSKHVKHIGLPSAISNQILKKYGMNKEVKEVGSVKLTIPRNGDGIRITGTHEISVACIKQQIHCWHDLSSTKQINQIEADNQYYYITFEVDEAPIYEPNGFIGVDLNATGHVAVIASSSKILKRGKRAAHIKRQYGSIRRRLRKQRKNNLLRKLKNKEARVTRDINHKLTTELVNLAKNTGQGIRMEDLKNIRIRTNKRSSKKTRRITNNWNFYQIRQFVEYKARICGVPVEFLNPAYTSKTCSRCGHLGTRVKKSFECLNCKHVEHADANAAFNIALAMAFAHISKVPDMKAVSEPAESALPLMLGEQGTYWLNPVVLDAHGSSARG
jgi:putative transposase